MNNIFYNTSIKAKGLYMQDERYILEAYANGNYSAIETLILRYEDSLFNLCLKLTMKRSEAEDLYQQTWLKVLKKPHLCKQSFKNWIYTICVNTYKDDYRRGKTQRLHSCTDEETEYALAVATDDVSAENMAIKNMTKELLIKKICQLQDKHRITVILHYFEGLDYMECAKVLGLPIGTVKSRLNSAKKTLRAQMEDELRV